MQKVKPEPETFSIVVCGLTVFRSDDQDHADAAMEAVLKAVEMIPARKDFEFNVEYKATTLYKFGESQPTQHS